MLAFSSLSFNTLLHLFLIFWWKTMCFPLKNQVSGKKSASGAAPAVCLSSTLPLHFCTTSPQTLLWSHPHPEPFSSSESRNQPLLVQVSSSQSSWSARPPLLWVTPLDVLLTRITLWTLRANASLFRLHPLCLWSLWRCRCLPLLLLPSCPSVAVFFFPPTV